MDKWDVVGAMLTLLIDPKSRPQDLLSRFPMTLGGLALVMAGPPIVFGSLLLRSRKGALVGASMAASGALLLTQATGEAERYDRTLTG